LIQPAKKSDVEEEQFDFDEWFGEKMVIHHQNELEKSLGRKIIL